MSRAVTRSEALVSSVDGERIQVTLELYPRLLRVAGAALRMRGVWRHEAGDVVHDVYLHTLDKLDRFASAAEIEPYLKTAVRHRVIDLARHAYHQYEPIRLFPHHLGLGEPDEGQESWMPQSLICFDDPALLVERRDEVQRLRRVLAALPERDQAALLEASVCDYAEYGARGQPMSQAEKSRLFRARRRLRRLWGEEWVA